MHWGLAYAERKIYQSHEALGNDILGNFFLTWCFRKQKGIDFKKMVWWLMSVIPAT
jgi:hypothetical protein